MNYTIENIKEEIVSSKFGYLFLSFGLLTQVIAWYLNNENLLSLISGLTGIIAVVYCSERKLSFYVFAWIQLITYVILAYQQRLYGEIWENIFYALTMLFGMYIWVKNYDSDLSVVESKTLTKKQFHCIIYGMLIGILIVYLRLVETDDTQPLIDSITTVPAIIAQILMILRYREQWLFWMIIDVFSVYMWFVADDYCMMMQYVFWTANCIYGYKLWKKN